MTQILSSQSPPDPTNLKRPETLEGLYKPGTNKRDKLGIVIYGRSGVGKTTLLGTMPGKGLVVDIPQVEGGTYVLSDQSDHIDVFPVRGWNDIVKVYYFLANGTHDYDWVAIDSITAMQELAKRKTIKERPLDQDPHIITKQDWGKVGRLVGELVYQFRMLPVHSLWIAQEKHTGGDEGGDESKWQPDLIPSAYSMLHPSMSVIVRLSVEHGLDGGWVRKMRVGPHPAFATKYRAMPGLDVPSVVTPHLGNLLAYLDGTGPRPEEIKEQLLVNLTSQNGGGVIQLT